MKILVSLILVSAAMVGPADAQGWLGGAHIAGAELDVELTNPEIFYILDEFLAQRASVVEVQTSLGQFLTTAEFDSEMVFISRTAAIGHQLGLNIVWYYPSLEVLSLSTGTQASMFSQHPDWVQYGLNSSYADPAQQIPNVFSELDDTTQVEHAFMCHLSPYRDFYFEGIRKLAQTGIDGIVIDETVFSDVIGLMACSNIFCRQKFEADTGLPFPTLADVAADTAIISQNFRRWLIWRHTELSQFLIDIKDAARAVNPSIEIIANVNTIDHNGATHKGLDLAYLGQIEGITVNWDIPPLSQSNAMRSGLTDDWLNLIAMNKFGRGISSPGRPAWALTAGLNEDDVSLVMAEAIAAQLGPQPTRVPGRIGTVDRQRRASLFSFIESYQDLLFQSQSAARVALIYSSSSRDFLDYLEGQAIYGTTLPPVPDPDWWTLDEGDGLLLTNYLAEYRGWVRALVMNHIPFDIVPVQSISAQTLQQYQTIILPNTASLSSENGLLIDSYLDGGGTMVVTGVDPLLFDEFGMRKLNPLSAKLLQTLPNVFYSSALVGKQSLKDTVDAQLGIQQLLAQIPPASNIMSTNAAATIHFELYQSAQKYILHSINYNALTGQFQPSPDTFSVTLQLPETMAANSVVVLSPDSEFNLGDIPFTADSLGHVTFNMSVSLYSVAAISFDNMPVQPFTPVRLPNMFAVTPGFPNPFRTTTKITLDLSVNSDVTVTIYNILGQRVRTLVQENRLANVYTIEWDGRDDNGSRVANGIYFCHIRAGIEDQFLKLTLM